MTAWLAPPSLRERRDAGRAARKVTPRSGLSNLTEANRDPLGIIDRQNTTRLQELLPLRTERMSQSAFAFYRGTAGIMAADLAADPHTGILVRSCGDAHVANFGFYASPQRTLVFDLNDFDEAAWAPWEWDVKRLVTSIVIAGQSTSRDDRVIAAAAHEAVRAYARVITSAAALSPADRYFAHLDLRNNMLGLDKQSRAAMKHAVTDAEKRTEDRATRRLTTLSREGRFQFSESPPTMTAVDDATRDAVGGLFTQYIGSTTVDIHNVLTNYVPADLALRVVGVGSVGTRCYLILLQDGEKHALILQGKEAGTSVLIEFGGIAQPSALTSAVEQLGQGARVVGLQRTLQAVSDPFLGYLRGPEFDFYVRQFHDMKGSIDIETLEDQTFTTYSSACALTLARAHSQSPDAGTVSGYLGSGRTAANAIVEWAYAYAALSHRDYEAFVARG